MGSPPSGTGDASMRFEFRDVAHASDGYDELVTDLHDPWHVFKSQANTEQDYLGLHLYCRDGAGAGVMRTDPREYGTWTVRSRISSGLQNPSTKVCLLLWPDGGEWPPEIDFNESADRTRSHQTEHYGPTNAMHHTNYGVD